MNACVQAYLSLSARVESLAQGQIVQILPVSKGQSVEKIRAALSDERFPRRLGENYLEELQAKHMALQEFPVEWHYLGRLQSRKISEICAVADVIHTVTRAKELELISREPRASKIRFFFQVNVSSEDQKNGCAPSDLPALFVLANKLNLGTQIAGLMALPAAQENAGEENLRSQFRLLRTLRDQYVPQGLLSMGMSDDFEIAIQEGAQILRIGTALFGERSQKN